MGLQVECERVSVEPSQGRGKHTMTISWKLDWDLRSLMRLSAGRRQRWAASARVKGSSLGQSAGEGENVLVVEIGGRLIERHNPTVDAKGFRERETDDDGSEDLLSGRAATSHVHLGGVLEHDDL